MVVPRRSKSAGPQIHIADPQPDRRSRHLRWIDLPTKDPLAKRRDVVKAAPFSESHPQHAVGPTPVDIVIPAHPEPPIPEPLKVSPHTVRIMAVGESRAVHRPGTHAADDVEPVTPLCNQVLASPHLPTALGSSSGQYQRSPHND